MNKQHLSPLRAGDGSIPIILFLDKASSKFTLDDSLEAAMCVDYESTSDVKRPDYVIVESISFSAMGVTLM